MTTTTTQDDDYGGGGGIIIEDESLTPPSSSPPPSPPSFVADDDVEDQDEDQDEDNGSSIIVNDHIVWTMISIFTTLWLVLPTLLIAMMIACLLIGQAWFCIIFSIHLTLNLLKVRFQIAEMSNSSSSDEALQRTSINNNKDEEIGAGSDQETRTEEFSTTTLGGASSGGVEGENNHHQNNNLKNNNRKCTCTTFPTFGRFFTSSASILDIILFGGLYQILMIVFNDFFVDTMDQTIVVEWTYYYYTFFVLKFMSWSIVSCRLLVGFKMVMMTWTTGNKSSNKNNNKNNSISSWVPSMLTKCFQSIEHVWLRFKIRYSRPPKFIGWWKFTILITIVSILMMVWTMFLAVLHIGSIEQIYVVGPQDDVEPYYRDPSTSSSNNLSSSSCDPLDESECVLPFPSSYYLKRDKTTPSGWRVNFQSNSFPPLKGRREFSVDFLNQLDGFSTMGPILFHLDGLMESHDAYLQEKQQKQQERDDDEEEDHSVGGAATTTRLCGNDDLEVSTTPHSTTLLLDIDSQQLIPHSAEIDYLDAPKRPLVMVFPAQPLNHNTHYAVAVINAADVNGNRLPPTNGMKALLFNNNHQEEGQEQQKSSSKDQDAKDQDEEQPSPSRHEVFVDTVLPALEIATMKAASATTTTSTGWGGYNGAFSWKDDPEALQLLFDFRTISRESQLGTVQAVRDATLTHLQLQEDVVNADSKTTTNWWSSKQGSTDEDHHVRVIQQQEGDCIDPLYPIARTLHLELDVPWFLNDYGPGSRDATIDAAAVDLGVPTFIGKAKAVVQIPCSLKQAAFEQSASNNTTSTGTTSARPLRAVLEYGHGLFGSRMEAGDAFLIKMAHDNGYIIVAMDWRGMSKYDFPLLARTMLDDPSMFESIRDNLIQGYSNKFALQHFVHNGLLDMDWLQFKSDDGEAYYKIPRLQQEGDSNNTTTTTTSQQQKQYSLIDDQVPLIFYGNSQGGILGAGYVRLSGETGYISRAVLGVPGTSFSFIIARSLAFVGYNLALLTNFYNGRHVRIFLSLAQMCWDSVEAAGVLAGAAAAGGGSHHVDHPTMMIPPILIQTGLGDAVVPAVSAERLARAFGAHILPSNPRTTIFGIPTVETTTNAAGEKADVEQLQQPSQAVTLQEILYEEDYDSLPGSNQFSADHNDVHNCVRLDPSLKVQVAEFINSGKVIDPCGPGGADCIRQKAIYNKSPMKFKDLFNTKRDVPGPHQVQVCNP